MKTKVKPRLILAGPGAGKTNYIINQVSKRIPLLDSTKYLVVITYTNAATQEIKERLAERVTIPTNVFIGTIHSFLIRFLIKPYGKLFNHVPESLVYKGINYSTNDPQEVNLIKSILVKKGIVPYESVGTISKKIINDKKVREIVSNRIQYLFVDEFQDTDSAQYTVFDQIRIAGLTEIIYVGDPEQSIMSFQNKGRSTTSMDKRAIHKVINSQTVSKERVEGNYRSSKTIIDFINNFHMTIQQSPSNIRNIPENAVCLITASNDISEIVEKFNELCIDKRYCSNKPKTRFFLGYEGKTYKNVANKFELISKKSKNSEGINVLEESSNFVCEVFNQSSKSIIENMKIDLLEFRKLCMKVIHYITSNQSISAPELIEKIKLVFEDMTSKSTHLKTKDNIIKSGENLINIVNVERLNNSKGNSNDFYMTIHKSKGLEADAVLIIAKTVNELRKWLEQDEQKRYSDKQDTCRIGYVGFSRAKELLCIACFEEIDTDLIARLRKLQVTII